MATLIDTTESSWQTDVAEASGTVLVDFWAAWCGPCRMMEPMLVDLAERLDGRLAVARVDVQAYPDLAARCGVMNLPTLVLYRGGQPIEQFSGYMPLRVLEERVLKAL